MKIYKRFKNFIPDSFYYRKNKQNDKYINFIISILLIVNLIFLPVNLKKINSEAQKNVKSIEMKSYSDIGSYNLITVKNIVSELFEDRFEEVYIKNDCGELLVNNLNNLDMIIGSGLLSISEAAAVEEGKYRIGVNINEQ